MSETHESRDAFPRFPSIVVMILSSLPLLAYPFILMANLMSLVAERSPEATAFERFASTAFIVLSTAYPVAWIAGLIGSVYFLVKQRPMPAAWAASAPLMYLGLTGGVWWLWSLA